MKIKNPLKSISLKLTVLYVGSVLLVLTLFLTTISYYSRETALTDAQRTMEVGPGFLNGITPETVTGLPEVDDIDIEDVIEKYTPFMQSGIFSARGEADDNGNLLNYTIISNEDTGFVTLYPEDFPATLFVKTSATASRDLFYREVEGFEGVLIVASVEVHSLAAINSSRQFTSIIILFSPLVVALAVLFGWFVSNKTVAPIKKIALAAERINERDISHRVQVNSSDEIGSLARSFNRMAERLENSFESQKQFVSDAAHELRTPLASMKTSVTKALSVDKGDEGNKELLVFLSGRIDTMETLTSDLLFLARSDEGRLGISKARFDLSTVVSEAEEAFRYLFEDKGVRFTAKSETGLYIKADPKLILRAVSNLLDNAAKNTPAGNSVNLMVKREGDYAVIAVSDTGSGIPEEHLDKVFRRFYKVPDSPAAKNSFGLGLSITKSIVSHFGGEISVQSEPGSGSTFTVRLPLA